MGNRWLNQYALRYSVGTVVGAIIVSYLFLRLPAEVRSQAPALDSWGKIVVLGAAGLTFCYIASAPLLVMHVCRSMVLARSPQIGGWGPAALVIMIFALTAIVVRFSIWSGSDAYTAFFALGAIGSLLTLQMFAVMEVVRLRNSLLKFYTELASKRAAVAHSEIVESYRDMREHGNAFAIVLFEVFLGVTLNGLLEISLKPDSLAGVFNVFLVILGLWIVPAACVLYIAARLEIDFAH